MISRIRGKIIEAGPRCVVDVGGVGFELVLPEKDVEAIRPDSRDATFYTYLYVREDRMLLFGFLDPVDRELFLKLIEVSGVGPKLAMGAISLQPAHLIVAAIRRGDAAFLQKLPGLGKKTAERLCIELADKLDAIAVSSGAGPVDAPSELREEVVLALTSLGMTRGSAEATLDKMKWRSDDTSSVEEIVREALRYTSS